MYKRQAPRITTVVTPASCPSQSEISLLDFWFTPNTIRSSAPEDIKLTHSLKTNGTGINQIETEFVSPEGDYFISFINEDLMNGYGNPINGNSKNGVYESTWGMAWMGLEGREGTWTVSGIRIIDSQSSSSQDNPLNTLFPPACISDLGFSIVLNVAP